MKKTTLCAAALVIVIAILFLYVTDSNNKYDDEWILHKTSIEIEERYGEFEFKGSADEDGRYRSYICGYITKKGHPGFLGYSHAEYYAIRFDGGGRAVEIIENYIRPGG